MKTESIFCEICGNENRFNHFKVKENMIGLNELFTYTECLDCGCLQLRDIPSDYTKYYDKNYYSMNSSEEGWIKKRLKIRRFDFAQGKKSILGWILSKKYGRPPLMNWLDEINLNFNDKILDVGCGHGHLLKDLFNYGFKDLTGIDVFIKTEINYGPKFRILKKNIFDLEGEYDFIMLHHSFEHMQYPAKVFGALKSKLKKGKNLLIRIPLADSYAWKTYGINWVSLDAPRHIFLHTKKSIELLTKFADFSINKIKYDSTSFQFWASEQYKKGIPLFSENSYLINPAKSFIGNKEIMSWESEANRLNQISLGDQACFFLTH